MNTYYFKPGELECPTLLLVCYIYIFGELHFGMESRVIRLTSYQAYAILMLMNKEYIPKPKIPDENNEPNPDEPIRQPGDPISELEAVSGGYLGYKKTYVEP